MQTLYQQNMKIMKPTLNSHVIVGHSDFLEPTLIFSPRS